MSVRAYKDDWDTAAVAWQSQYRFSISVENSSTPGYSTEKIVHALAAGTIPVYFGDPLIDRVFNPRRFINVHELGLEAAMEQVRRLDADAEAFEEMVSQPIFRDGLDQWRDFEPWLGPLQEFLGDALVRYRA